MNADTLLKNEFVGRDQELDLVSAALDSAETLVLCFHGIAGIGKSWLLKRASAVFTKRGVCCAILDLSSYGSLDYLHFLTTLRNQLSGPWFESFDACVQELQQRLVKLYQPLISTNGTISVNVEGNTFQGSVGDIVGIKIENLSIFIPRSEMERLYNEMQGKITRAFLQGLQSLVQTKPVIVFIDNYEKIEDPTERVATDLSLWIEREFLSALRDNPAHLLFVITRREALTWAARNREWKGALKQHGLPYLTVEESIDYLAKRDIHLIQQVERDILAIARGHPQILALIVDLLIELGTNITLDILGNLPEHISAEFDEKIVSEFLVESILSRLPPDLSTLISRLAVPHWFDVTTIAAFTGSSVEDSLSMIEKLQKYSFVSRDKGSRYFYHDVVRSFLYKRLQTRAYSEIVKWHGVAYNYYTALLASVPDQARLEIQLEALYHLVPADEDRAVKQMSEFFEVFDATNQWDNARYLIKIMKEQRYQSRQNQCWIAYYKNRLLEREYDWVQARDNYLRILKEPDLDAVLKAKMYANLGRAYWLLDELENAIEAYKTSAALFLSLGDKNEYAWSIRKIAKIYRKQFRLSEALAYCKECIEIFEASRDRCRAGWSYLTLGEIYKQCGDFQLAQEPLETSLSIWEELGNEYGTVDTLSALSDVHRFSGNLVEAKAIYQQSLVLFKKCDDDYGVGWSLHGLGEILRMQGQLSNASHYTLKSLNLFSAMHYRFGMAWNTRSLGEVSRMQGQFETALNLYQQSQDLFDQCGDAQGKIWVFYSIGDVYLAQGRLSEAKNVFTQVKQDVGASDQYMLARVNRSLADLNRELGDLEQAEACNHEALKIFTRQENLYQQAICKLNLSRIWMAEGKKEDASRILFEVLDEFTKREDSYHYLQTLVLLWRAAENDAYLHSAEAYAQAHDLAWFFNPFNPSYARKASFG